MAHLEKVGSIAKCTIPVLAHMAILNAYSLTQLLLWSYNKYWTLQAAVHLEQANPSAESGFHP